MEENKSYRIRTTVGDKPNVINVQLNQTFDMFEILSLKFTQQSAYKLYESSYGIVVGRVLANGGFGIPNAKVSIFIPKADDMSIEDSILYPYSNVTDSSADGIRYNLLPDSLDDSCYQNVGTFPNKRLLLDNNDLIEIFDEYWKYTTTTNQSGDYMLFGIPSGNQTLHVDIDLSDIGLLSQRPRDMIYKGYDANMFESPNKFKQSTNLDSLAQIYSQNSGLYVYPFWGDTSNGSDTIAVTRCDVQIQYTFEPTCVFIGSIITDTGSNAIGKNCTATQNVGKMSDLITGEGSIEMIRKTIDGRVEEFPIKGNRVIDGDGVWCYQIPMNLDYVTTDEYGNMVPTDNPEKGIPTRTRVRFRISLDEAPSDNTARKRCRYLVPNNPRMTDDYPIFSDTKFVNYEFGTNTREEDYRDMFWNQVYTVKSYIPRLQKSNSVTNRKHTGVKMSNHFNGNNPMPYNGMTIKLTFQYRLICVLATAFITLVGFLNNVLGVLLAPFCAICKILSSLGRIPLVGFIFRALKKPFCAVVFKCIKLNSEFCDDGINKNTYYPGCWGCHWDETKDKHNAEQAKLPPEERTKPNNDGGLDEDSQLRTCIENELAQSNEATSFNFYNDWINGVLYAPMWYRKITPKKSYFFGLIKVKAKDQWCSAERPSGSLRLLQQCAVQYGNSDSNMAVPDKYNDKCHNEVSYISIDSGIVVPKTTMLGQTVYYYKAVEYDNSLRDVKLLFATDIVLLGSLNNCDLNGTPQFFKSLESTTYNLPTDILFVDEDAQMVETDDGKIDFEWHSDVEMTGCDWGNINKSQECGKADDGDSGLFYSIGCNSIRSKAKSCINVRRICEFGVSLDEAKGVPSLANLSSVTNVDEAYDTLIPDGFVSYDELYNFDERAMFATMNGNNLRTRLNKENGLPEYDFKWLYPTNFDGSMRTLMENRQKSCNMTYRLNYQLEILSEDYIKFRMGEKPYFYDKDRTIPRFENSFYFYFGLHSGKTAIEKFNSQFFSECVNATAAQNMIGTYYVANDWCSDDDAINRNGFIALDLTGISTPYDISFVCLSDGDISSFSKEGVTDEKVYVGCYNKINPDEYGRLEGYKALNDCEKGSPLVNGEWEIVITDSNGENISQTINFVNEYLSYKVDTYNFTQPNNILFTDYSSYQEIATDVDGIDGQIDTNIRTIGGVIVIHDIFYQQEILNSNFQIEVSVQPNDFNAKQDFPNQTNPKTYNGITIKNGRVAQGTYGLLGIGMVNDTPAYYIGVPKGGVQYAITVTQMCGNSESGNMVSRTVTIKEPTPFRFYVNDVDVELLQNFKTGWTTGGSMQINSMVGWQEISNVGVDETYKVTLTDGKYPSGSVIKEKIELLSRVNDGKSKYYWIEDYRFKITTPMLMYFNGDTFNPSAWNEGAYANVETQQVVVDAINEIIQKRIDLATKMKTAFYLSCPTEDKTINLTVMSDAQTQFVLAYSPESIPEEGGNNIVEQSEWEKTNDSSLSDIMIPTLTNVDNELYGQKQNSNSYSNSGYCFARDNSNGNYKRPYYVATMQKGSKIITIPSNVGESDFESKNLRSMFGFHIIDKTLRLNYVAWAYMRDIPLFWPGGFDTESKDYDGKVVRSNGLLAGSMFNGISTSTDKWAKFEAQSFGSKTVYIETLTMNGNKPNEDAIPTKRVIVGETDNSSNEGKIYPNYKMEGLTGGQTYFMPVPNATTDFVIEDDSCVFSQEIYGNLAVKISGSSLNHSTKDDANVLNVSVSNGDDNVTYYLMKLDNANDYIINKLKTGIFEANTYNDYGFMRLETTEDKILEKVVTGASSERYDEETQEDVASSGYGTSGEFKLGSNHNAFYVIAKTGNNCFAVSPVYDYGKVTVEISLMQSEVTPLDGGETGITYSIVALITEPEKRYYLRNFSFNCDINLNVSSSIISDNKTIIKSESDASIYEKVSSLPSTGDSDKLYYTEVDGQYTVYSYANTWASNTATDTSFNEAGDYKEIDFSTNKYQYIKYGDDAEIPYTLFTYKEITDATGAVTGHEIEVTDAFTEDDIVGYTLIAGSDGKKIYCESDGVYYYYDFVVWSQVGQPSPANPTAPHYKKVIDFNITKEQYDTISAVLRLPVVGTKQLSDNTIFTITDTTGLKTLCRVAWKRSL